jgi:2-methylcitrate dehydratase PrpD
VGTAQALAAWAIGLEPTAEDLALADRALTDTLAVTLAAPGTAFDALARELPEPGRWAALAHLLDFDDLHMASTAHLSAVCVPLALATGGGARGYLVAAGAMARLGTALGWEHYTRGWHATCTAGAPAAAAGAAVALGLDAEGVARAMALAVPAAGGVQRAFGTSAKSLQVGFTVDAGVRAARLAMAGATADPAALDQWLALMGGDPSRLDPGGPAVPGGLAVKAFPCCYALQRPMAATRELALAAADVERVTVRTPRGTLQPLIHSRPRTGLEGKFSLEHAVAVALLDPEPGFASFTDEAVTRPAARALVERVVVEPGEGENGLLDGEVELEVLLRDGSVRRGVMADPPGAPSRPPTPDELAAKVRVCVGDLAPQVLAATWDDAAGLLREQLGP